ncbi:MAG: hypothetical protein AAFZ15_24790 [Bacteroidota bacterium]
MFHDFLLKNWFDLLQSAFIMGGFVLSCLAVRRDTRSRKLGHLIHLNQSHREIWGKTYSNPELLRIRKSDIDLDEEPITEAERRMATEVIMHIFAVYEAIRNGQLDRGEMEKDISDYLNLPIPNTVWQKVKVYHNKRFVNYIDELLLNTNDQN